MCNQQVRNKIQLETERIATKAMQNWQNTYYGFLPFPSWVTVPTVSALLQSVPKKNTEIWSANFQKKLHFEICHYSMSLPGSAVENFT